VASDPLVGRRELPLARRGLLLTQGGRRPVSYSGRFGLFASRLTGQASGLEDALLRRERQLGERARKPQVWSAIGGGFTSTADAAAPPHIALGRHAARDQQRAARDRLPAASRRTGAAGGE